MKTNLMILAVMMLVACLPEPDMSMQSPQRITASDGSRITVERIGIFSDDIAYNKRRGVYVIRDKTADREFIGVSGVGIAETGSYQSGKFSVRDER